MSFTGSTKGIGFKAGHFLVDDEQCVRLTMTIAADHDQVVTRTNGTKYVPAGAIIPSNDGNAKGILYEDIDVTKGDAPGSVVTEGIVYTDLLPEAPSEDTTEGGATTPGAATALANITFIAEHPTITRPY